MKYCKKCLQTSLRPNVIFNKESVCYPCQFNSRDVNWEERLFKLKKLIKKNLVNKEHDCILGVSGGKDSTIQALFAREKLKLNPLLVSIGYTPLQSTDLGFRNLENLLKLGFDIQTIQPAPQTSKNLSKKSFFANGNLLSFSEMALFSQVPRYAIDNKFKLILWGENVSIHIGESGPKKKDIFDGNFLRKMNTLSKIKKYTKKEDFKKKQHIKNYIYPSEKEFIDNNINLLFLGPAIQHWNMLNNGFLSILNGFEPKKDGPKITGDITKVAMLDEDFTHINNMIKYFKFGFGRATEFVNEAIRGGLLTRSESIKIVKKYDGICDQKIIKKYCKYIEIQEDDFWHNVKKFTNKKIFRLSNTKKPIPLFTVGQDFE